MGNTWTPSPRARSPVSLGSKPMMTTTMGANGVTSSPSTPLIRAHTSSAALPSRASAALSPNLGSSSSPFNPLTNSTSTRSPSPTRPRSPPQRFNLLSSTSNVTTPTAASETQLRGQNDPFPRTIDYLPSSVSTRSLHSPSLRSPILSTSPGSTSTTSSPLTSPNLYASTREHSSLAASTSQLPGSAAPSQRRVKSATSTGVRRVSNGDSTVLLPPFPILNGTQSSSTPPPARPRPISPQRGGFVSTKPATADGSRASPIPSSPSRPKLTTPTLSRPPSTSQNTFPRHQRSHSTTSTSSSVFSGNENISSPLSSTVKSTFVEQRPASSNSWSRKDSGNSLPHNRSSGTSDQGLMGIDWSRPTHYDDDLDSLDDDEDDPRREELELNRTNEDDDDEEDEEVPSMMDKTVVLSSGMPTKPEFMKRASVDELREEKEARIQRKILDLEITNASLLSINATLERQKLKHTQEIRDLRRRMRESNAGLALAPFRTSPRKNTASSSSNHDPEDEEDDSLLSSDEEDEGTWEELLEDDPYFAAVCHTIEALLRRGKAAVEQKIGQADLKGRVLTAVEIEDEEEMIRWVDVGVQTDSKAATGSGSISSATSSAIGARNRRNGATPVAKSWQR